MVTVRIKEALFWVLIVVSIVVVLANEIHQTRQLDDVTTTTDRIEERFTVHERTPTALPGSIG